MNHLKNGEKLANEYFFINKIIELAGNIQDGSISIIKQDSIVIQINTYEKILLKPEYKEVI